MKTFLKDCLLLCLPLCLSVGCTGSDEEKSTSNDDRMQMGITAENFPVIDGSDSTTPLRTMLVCRLFGLDYSWERRPFTPNPNEDLKMVCPRWSDEQGVMRSLLLQKMKTNNTHESFMNLIDNSVELIVTARGISRDEQAYARQKGVELVEKAVAQDALVFLVNPKNVVKTLTKEQVRNIYTGQIVNWKEVGGADAPIQPYVRNANSGSQEKFETMVMTGLQVKNFPEMQVGRTMLSPYQQLKDDVNGIGFTPYYYYHVIVDNHTTHAIGIDGVQPSGETILNHAYPYHTYVYVAVRADLDRQSKAYRLFEYLTSPKGQNIVVESGYQPLPPKAVE